jgi:hypothetical protein
VAAGHGKLARSTRRIDSYEMPFRIVVILVSVPVTSPLFGSQFWGVVVANGTSVVLNPIDVATGSVSDSSTSGSGLAFTPVLDLASDPIRHPNVVWAVRSSIVGNELIAVDPFEEELLSNKLLDAPSPITSLAMDPTSGHMFGASNAALYQISIGTGQTTLIGPTSSSVAKGLGFDLDGNLYGIGGENVLVTVNKSTAAINVIAPMNVNRMEDIAVRPEDGIMYGLGFAYNLYQIDLATGALTTVGPSLSRPSGAALTSDPNLPGDFNGDRIVDAADYVTWRKGLGTTHTPDHFNRWRANFGMSDPAGSGASDNAAVPEPSSLYLILFATIIYASRRRASTRAT